MNAARVTGTSDAGDGLTCLTVEVPPEVESSFSLPGQYLELAVAGFSPRPFAIASAPGFGNRLEFLVRHSPGLADALARLKVGDPVSASRALGPGFPLQQVQHCELVLVATGVGAAPMRSVIETLAPRRGDFGEVTFYFGGRHGRDFAFESEWGRWRALGVTLVRTVSEVDPEWTGLRGFVQDHFGDKRWANAAAFVVGSNPMVQAVTAELVKREMPRERIFLNL